MLFSFRPFFTLPVLALVLSNPSRAEPAPALKPEQIVALGIRAEPVAGAAMPGGAAGAVRYPGVVVVPPGQARVVATPWGGLVEALFVSVGDPVKAGQPLARLRSAQAQELQRELDGLRVQADVSGRALARDEALHKEGLIARSRLEATEAQHALAKAQRDQREVMVRQATGAPVAADGSLLLRAPAAGVVVERGVEVGQRVEAATALYRVAQLAPLWVELQVPAPQAAEWRVGQRVQVPVPGQAEPAQGRVRTLGATVDAGSQTVLMRAELPQPKGLRAGQAVEGWVEAQAPVAGAKPAAHESVQVPEAAVLHQGAQAYVYVEEGAGRYRAVAVAVLSSGGGLARVRGLPAQARVVVAGTAALKALVPAPGA